MFKYSFDFKFKAVKYVVYGKHSYREAARKFNVHQEQIKTLIFICLINRFISIKIV